jgi:hypothetical protein
MARGAIVADDHYRTSAEACMPSATFSAGRSSPTTRGTITESCSNS